MKTLTSTSRPLTVIVPCALLLLLAVVLSLHADQFGDFTYTDHGTYIAISDYPTTATGHVDIPAEIAGKPVTSIEDYAFASCSGLTNVTIPSSVTSIGDYAFRYCNGLTAISVESGNVNFSSLDGVLFDEQQSLLIEYPEGLTGAYAIPSSVTSIGSGAFASCSGLTNVTIPSSVTSIGDYAFIGCSGLTAISVESGNVNFSSLDGVLFDEQQSLLIEYPEGLTGAYAIPSGVTSIGSGAFSSCSGLTSVTIPSGVTGIGSSAFSGCSGLTSVTIPASVTSIGSGAFYRCRGLTTVVFLGDAPSMGSRCFVGSAPGFTIHYLSGSTGFTSPTWSGYSAVMIVEPYHFEYSGGVPDKLVWQTVAGQSYDLWFSEDLTSWSQVSGFPQTGSGAPMEHPFTPGARGFFQITSEGPDFESFALIPAGSFLMGDQTAPNYEGGSDERPQHSVYVSAFYMARFEVTKALWDEVRAWGLNNGYTDLPAGGGKAANHPVHSINWYAMVKWCNARSEQWRLSPCYRVGGAVYRTGNSDSVTCDWNASGYRLPSEAEWEKAARGGLSSSRFPWGETISHDNANFWNGRGESYQTGTTSYHPAYDGGVYPPSSPVGSFAPNGYGLYDMVGNMSERCWDWWGSYPRSSQTDPHGPRSGSVRVRRGGSWGTFAANCRVAYRYYYNPSNSNNHHGFRPARSSDR